MCLVPIEEIKTAETDILCYKWVFSETSLTMWMAPYQGNRFPFNSLLEAEPARDGIPFRLETVIGLNTKFDLSIVINKGFHAYVSRDSARRNWCFEHEDPYLATCVIPKDSEYCLGENDEIVSTHMIVFSDDGEYEKYAAEHNDIEKLK